MANTDLRQIRHLVALGRHLSFTKAAKELGITQSALTRSVQAVEARAGVRLFDRDRGRVTLSEVGKAYVARATDLLRDADELDRQLHQAANAEAGEVQFGMTSALARALMPEVLTRVLDELPGLRTRILIGAPEAMVALVQSEQIEFCICGELPTLPAALRATIIGPVPLALLVRRDHPALDGSRGLDLREFPLVLSGQVAESETIPNIALPLRLAPPSLIIDEIGTLAHLAATTDAIWLTTPYAATEALRVGYLCPLPLPPGLDMQFRSVIYSHSRRTLSPAARRLIDATRLTAGRLAASFLPRS